MQVRKRLKLQIGEYDWQSLTAFIRMFVFGLALVVAVGWFGSTRLDGINPRDIADEYRNTMWFLQYMPEPILVLIASIFNVHSLRYMIAPMAAIICVLIAGAYFVQDVYALPEFMHGWRYVLASMFGMNYPVLTIDKGEPQLQKGETNLIDKIGGPGFVIIEPGNAATFRKLRGPTDAKVSEVYFLSPFEVLAQAVNLDDQHGYKEAVSAVTRDGIKVVIKDINFRFRVKQEAVSSGEAVQRSLNDPYPFSQKAIQNMTFGLVVEKNGVENWRKAVDRLVVGVIADYVAENDIDFLTAPRDDELRPRQQLQKELFTSYAQKAFGNIGAELLWVDVGHIEIEDMSIDEMRTALWSATWAGNAEYTRAIGEGIRKHQQEVGRAESEAELIASIANTLSEAQAKGESKENIRKILITRTAQILEALCTDCGDKGE